MKGKSLNNMENPIIAPSLLAAQSINYGQAIAGIEKAGAKYLHIDVMDGHFVPNLSFGPSVVEGIRKASSLYFDVHLMIEYPEKKALPFIKAGADCITIHVEAPGDIESVLRICTESNVGFGLSLKPMTPVNKFQRYYRDCEILLIMSVEPGFGGQNFIPEALERIAQAKRIREETGAKYKISVDGGINLGTAAQCVSAGADILVVGTTVFSAENPGDVIKQLMRV